jgi:hypothetical protein
MGIGDILCEYIYGSFLLVKAALEVAQKTSKALLKAADTLFNTLMSLVRYVIDVGIETILNAIRVFQKWLVDKLLNFDFDAICQGLFKCTEFLEQILDPNSLLCRTIRKYTNYNSAPQETLYGIIGDFRQFKDQVCSFGFTYNFGLSAVKEMLDQYYAMCTEFLDMLERNKERVRRFLQKYLDKLIDIGTFDMLDRLKKYFDCVLIDTEICSNIRTANSFYKTMLKKMCIEESGDGYKLDSNMSAEYMNTFDSRINNLNNAKNDLKKLIDSMLTPSQVNAANNAFNLAANIFPGGASWKDIKNGDFWKKNKCYQYFKMKRREVIASFKAQNSAYASVGSDAILGGMSIDDEKGFIEITMNGEDGFETYRYDEQNPLPGMELVHEDTPIEYTIKQTNDKNQTTLALVNEKDEIISSMYGAIDIAVNGNEELKEKVMKIGGLKGYTNESELMTSGV